MSAARNRRYPKAARHVSSAALLAVGGLALYNWMLAPHVGYLHAVQQLGPVVGRVTQERERIRGSLDGKVTQWRTLQQDKAKLDEGVFTEEQAKAFVRGLLPVVEKTGCEVLRAEFNPDARMPRLDEPNLPVVIEVSLVNLDVLGQLDQVSALLQQLRDGRPRAWIDSCRCDFPGGDAGQVECNLALALYVIVDRQDPARKPSEPVAGGAARTP